MPIHDRPHRLLPGSLAGSMLVCLVSTAHAQAPGPFGPRIGGYVQARETWRSGAGLTGTINRARVGVTGALTGGWFYAATAELASGDSATTRVESRLRDAYLGWRGGGFAVQAGQYKTPFSAQYLTQLTRVETADRAAVVHGLAPERDIGVMGSYAWKQLATLAVGVFNGRGQNVGANNDSTVLVVGRATVRPVQALTIGANVARYRDSTRYGLDAALAYAGWGLKAEYLWQHRLAVGRDDRGYYVMATYWLLPGLQLLAEQEDFERPAIPTFPRNTAWVAGANLFVPRDHIRLSANYVSRRVGTRTGAVITEAQVQF